MQEISGSEGHKTSTKATPIVHHDLFSSSSAVVHETLTEIEQSMGLVPDPLRYLTDESLPGIWQETKSVEFAAESAIPAKYRDLINLGVSAQIPCRYNVYFDLKSSEANGATAQEQTEAVVMSAITRHWSTILNGIQIDMAIFNKEVDQVMGYVKAQMAKSATPPPAEFFLVQCTTVAEAYKDIEATLGIVPSFFLAFPERGLPGAWREFKSVQLNPHTAVPPKYKELIGLGVAAQIPCSYCVSFHRAASRLYGATDDEFSEALALAALTRQWSAMTNGLQIDDEQFRDQVNHLTTYLSERNT
jgi:AhpD family alkylhydroperoxidase